MVGEPWIQKWRGWICLRRWRRLGVAGVQRRAHGLRERLLICRRAGHERDRTPTVPMRAESRQGLSRAEPMDRGLAVDLARF